MSKPLSELFDGTKGAIAFRGDAEEIIASRVDGMDLRAHPVAQKQLNARTRRMIAKRIRARTATREEYERYMWDKRFRRRRRAGVKEYWKQERKRLESGEQGTRNWSREQRLSILAGGAARFKGRTLHAHHTYSARIYPQLANRGEVIYPATQREHLTGWHGGAYRNSLPGKRIRRIQDF